MHSMETNGFLFSAFFGYFASSQYALLLSYFQYTKHILDSDIPTAILQLSEDGQEDEELDLEKVYDSYFTSLLVSSSSICINLSKSSQIDKDQAELALANFAILKKEDHHILNLVRYLEILSYHFIFFSFSLLLN